MYIIIPTIRDSWWKRLFQSKGNERAQLYELSRKIIGRVIMVLDDDLVEVRLI